MRSFFLFLGALALLGVPGWAQGQFDDVEIESVKISDRLYMLKGAGGNIGLSVGQDGPLLIDDQYAPLSEKIQAAVSEFSDQPIRFVVNTHWHGDHTGGNENLGKRGAVIVAHENVRVRLSQGQFLKAFNRHVNPSPREALPVVTFADGLKLHWNEDELEVTHLPAAHTDGDAVIYFKKANVVHTGDLYFNGMYPFVDASSGGSCAGLVAACKRLLNEIDDKTVIIPGHGPLSNKAEFAAYVAMIEGVQGKIKALMESGKTRDEVIAAKPTEAFDERWGGGFFKPDAWVGLLYDSMVNG